MIQKASGADTSLNCWLFFSTYYVFLVSVLKGAVLSASAEAAAARTDKAFLSQRRISLKSSWYVEPVLSWCSWKIQSFAEISSVLQGLDRTLVDKVFAICDYYLQNRIKKHSRHIYDIYKLLPLVEVIQDSPVPDYFIGYFVSVVISAIGVCGIYVNSIFPSAKSLAPDSDNNDGSITTRIRNARLDERRNTGSGR